MFISFFIIKPCGPRRTRSATPHHTTRPLLLPPPFSRWCNKNASATVAARGRFSVRPARGFLIWSRSSTRQSGSNSPTRQSGTCPPPNRSFRAEIPIHVYPFRDPQHARRWGSDPFVEKLPVGQYVHVIPILVVVVDNDAADDVNGSIGSVHVLDAHAISTTEVRSGSCKVQVQRYHRIRRARHDSFLLFFFWFVVLLILHTL